MLEILAMTIGSAAAKIGLSIWMNEPELTVDATGGIVDSIFSFTKDKIVARRANRHFETISEKIAERLEYIISIEFKSLDKGDVEQVAELASAQLNRFKLTQELLVEKNFDANLLYKTLNEKTKSRKQGLSTAQVALLDRFLFETCVYAVDFALKLPSTTMQTLPTILQQGDLLIQQIHNIAKELQELQEKTYNSSPAISGSQFALEYARSVKRAVGTMELFGTNLSESSKRYPLSVAYIGLTVAKIQSKSGNNDFEEKTPIPKLINLTKKLMIRGPAGSGKTTILKWLALNIIDQNFQRDIDSWNYLTPFLIKLRQCVDMKTLPKPEEFPYLIAPLISHEMPHSWVHEKLRKGTAIVLIDGVDEITNRDEVRSWVEELTQTFPNSYYVITSRPLAKTDPWKLPVGFVEAEISPMEMPEIRQFVKHWHNAIKTFSANQHEIDSIDEMALEVVDIIRSNNAILELATTPILCAMICALNRDKARNIPQKRLELYEACTHMLVELREVERAITFASIPDLTYREKIMLLSDLAYYLLSNGWSEIDRGRAKDRLLATMKKVPKLKENTTPARLLDYFVERTGILREPSQATIDFAHRTFQEYLAAIYAIDNDNIGMLSNNATDSQWREVIILAAGIANQKQKKELLEEIILMGEIDVENKHQVHLLAVACLETVSGIEPSLYQTIIEKLEELIPPTNILEAKALATAGDLAVPHLQKSNEEYIEYIIRCLETIKTPIAIQTIAKYLDDADYTTFRLIIESFNRLSKDELGRSLLDNLSFEAIIIDKGHKMHLLHFIRHVDTLTISNYSHKDLPDLSHIKDTQELILLNCPNLMSLEFFASMRNLKNLKITGCNDLDNLNGIENFVELNRLEIDKTTINNLRALSTLTNLNILILKKLEITDLIGVAKLPLRRLELRKCYELRNIESIQRLSRLTNLVIEQCPNIFDLNGNLLETQRLRKVDLISTGDNSYHISDELKEKVEIVER